MTDASPHEPAQNGPPPDGSSPNETARTALVRVSQLLASGSGVGLENVLRTLGQSLGAEAVYFAAAPASPAPGTPPPEHGESPPLPLAPTHLHGRVTTWTRSDDSIRVTEPTEPTREDDDSLPDGDAAPGTDPVGDGEGPGDGEPVAVPLLADDGRFAGYLGIEGGAEKLSTDEDAPLSTIGHVLGAHLGRLAAEEALDRSEERWHQLVDRHPDPMLVVHAGAVGYANAAAAALLGVDDADALVGRPLDDFISAEDAPRVQSARELQLRVDGARPFEHDVIRADGATRHVESLSVPFPGADAGYQLVLRDLTDRVASEERYRTFVQTITEGVWRVRFTPPLPRGASARVLTSEVLARGRFAELNPAMLDILDSVSRPRSSGTTGRAPVDALPLRVALGPLGRVLARAFVEGGFELRSLEISVRRPGGEPAYLSINAVPRFENDALTEVWGSCTDITGRVEMERSMVAVLEDQQERIGRDLHDSVGQLLTGVRMLAEGLAEATSGTGLAGTASRIATYSAEALDRVREICHGLVPPQLYSEGAAGALAELVEHVDALGPTRCLFRREGAADVYDPDTALQVYRVVQEALSNALRHAGAEVVWVYLGRDGGDIVLEVEDDGVGFTPNADRSRSIGLYGMARRANSVGALLAVETEPGAGTTVRLTLPGAARGWETGGE